METFHGESFTLLQHKFGVGNVRLDLPHLGWERNDRSTPWERNDRGFEQLRGNVTIVQPDPKLSLGRTLFNVLNNVRPRDNLGLLVSVWTCLIWGAHNL